MATFCRRTVSPASRKSSGAGFAKHRDSENWRGTSGVATTGEFSKFEFRNPNLEENPSLKSETKLTWKG
jgi:hypothetical protein